jgi:hypothetical protein
MAEERFDARELSFRKLLPWTEIFRCFFVALDPKKLGVAAAGIVVMALGWWIISSLAWAISVNPASYKIDYDPNGPVSKGYQKGGLTEAEADFRAQADFDLYAFRYNELIATAKPGGKFNSWPWNEERIPNPYLVLSGQDRSWTYSSLLLTLIEPLRRFVEPVVYLLKPREGFGNRVYYFLITVWTLATWAFFGGVISRMAVLHLAGKERVTFLDSVRFVTSRYLAYLFSPLFPVALVFAVTIALAVYGLLNLVPAVGDALVSLTWFVPLLGGLVMAVLLLGLLGYPMMYPTISAEGSDHFDALTRSYGYLYQSFFHYAWYGLVAVAYGAVLVFLVGVVTSLSVYMGKWAVAQTPGADYLNRSPEFYFIYAPESFGWRELLLQGSPAVDANGRLSPENYEKYVSTLWIWNKAAAFVVGVWLTLVFLVFLGFGYSYFWVASSMIYLLMRERVDDTELDEVYMEDEDLDPLLPPAPPTAQTPTAGGTPLPVVDAPPTPAPAAPPPPLPAPAAVTPPPPPPEPTKPAAEAKASATADADKDK